MKNFTPDNKTVDELGDHLSSLLDIDLYGGIKALIEYTKNNNDIFKERAYKDSGIKKIQSIEDRHLSKFVKNITVEYSLLASTLDPDNTGKLECCSFLLGDNMFSKNVDEKYVECINQTNKTKGLSLYQHRDFLYDLQLDDNLNNKFEKNINWEDTEDGIKTCTLKNGECLTITIKRGVSNDKYSIDAIPSSDEHFRPYGDSLSLKAFVLQRSYEEMVSDAKQFDTTEGKTIKDIQNSLHSFCHKNITNANKDSNDTSVYFSFPIFSSRSSNVLPQYNIKDGAKQGIGACFVFFEPKDDIDLSKDESIEEIEAGIAGFVSETCAFIRFIAVNYVFNMGLMLQAQARKETIKSAKAAIMSRNMSHNLGSHVMAYLKQQLGSVTSIMKEENKVLANLIPDAVKDWNPEKAENVELPFLVGLGRFIGYLQERQDYIATISTDYIPYGAPVNLKDAIYDELNPDLRYLRHKNESNSDAKNKPANILLNYIAKSENLSRENMKDGFQSKNDIRFGYIDYSTGKPILFGLDTDESSNQDAFGSSNKALSHMRKINFSLPGGLVGRQAIFSIIENLIRNAAKHGDTSKVENLDYVIDIIDGSEVLNKTVFGWENGLRVSDIRWRKLYENAIDTNNLYILTITDNLPGNEVVIKNLQKGLYEPFVEANGQMTTANKGIKELRISSAWLRGVTDEDKYLKYTESDEAAISGNNNETERKYAPLVAVELSNDGHLRYIVCVRKNKTVAVVSRVKINEEKTIEFDAETIKKFGELHNQDNDCWDIVSDEELKKCKTSYSFILCPDSDEAFSRLRPYTSNRLCRWHVDAESNSVLKDSDSTLMYIYRMFTGLNNDSEDVLIDDPRAKTANENREKATGVIHFDKIKFDANDYKFLYRTHYATEKEYKAFYRDHIDKGEVYSCIEGITGDNSSDRLIRREQLDEKWYYTNLYALKKKVAIIDERIFKLVHSIDERLFWRDSDEVISVKELKAFSSEIDFEQLKDKMVDLTDDDYLAESIFCAKSMDELSQYMPVVPRNIVSCLNIKQDAVVFGESHLTPYYHGKLVDVYTVVKNAEGKMVLVGCVDTKYDSEKNTFVNKFDKVATFEQDGNGSYRLEPVSEEYGCLFANRYDYVSIHQGILDKVYENLGIKDKDEDKCLLTRCIHQSLMSDVTMFGKYLPRLIIHSGRAKPTKEDMPQKQPFVQYAAIENAVKDCKPMLVELLDFAKYEESNT